MPTVERIGEINIRPSLRHIRSVGGFAVDTVTPQRSETPCPATALAGAGLLSMLEDTDEPPQDRAARRHGRTLLSALSALQAGLLAGDPSAGLGHLAALLDNVPPPATPGLARALDAVLLRARIELLRHGG